ncbi:hypothetical protein QR680_006952 [Steinernema hermaphroditum]|uniref:SCP domain-containing protein n=1 Tax=Steinernema hermaphroditum TaxID=289476 RepID=A0AA39LY88_9BILA|nr:hypothetical protein QR680_006952 [Steinernema hermaphroditum]
MKSIFVLGIVLVSCAFGQNCPTRGLSADSRKTILDKHNQLRSQNALGQSRDGSTGRNAPKAKNMYKLSWDCELERIAQSWANRCQFKHSPKNLRNAGENIYKSWPTVQNDGPIVKAADSWWGELTKIGVGAYSSNFKLTNTLFSKGVGHYTQMAWARTTKLGCGHAKCSNMNLVVCNYRETGNYMDQSIYEIGNPCRQDSDCKTFKNSRCSAKEGLCYIAGGRFEELNVGLNRTVSV